MKLHALPATLSALWRTSCRSTSHRNHSLKPVAPFTRKGLAPMICRHLPPLPRRLHRPPPHLVCRGLWGSARLLDLLPQRRQRLECSRGCPRPVLRPRPPPVCHRVRPCLGLRLGQMLYLSGPVCPRLGHHHPLACPLAARSRSLVRFCPPYRLRCRAKLTRYSALVRPLGCCVMKGCVDSGLILRLTVRFLPMQPKKRRIVPNLSRG